MKEIVYLASDDFFTSHMSKKCAGKLNSFAAGCGFRSNRKLSRRFSSSPSYSRASIGGAAPTMAVRIDGSQKDIQKADSLPRLPPEDELLSAFESVLVCALLLHHKNYKFFAIA